jgi:cobalt-zinc-cadmium efflux system protein
VLVVLLILGAAWRVVRDSGRILLEAAPAEHDTRSIAADLAALDGVETVHHIHLWSISETRPMITLQARLGAGADPTAARRAIRDRLDTAHGIGHATIEIEHESP